jgi:hypothetical protein
MRRHSDFVSLSSLVIGVTFACPAHAQKPDCNKLLSPAEITDATGLTVGQGRPGPRIAGSQGSCVWQGSDGTKIMVVLSGKQQMQTTMDSMAQTGGAMYDGLGAGAVGTQGIPETGGGYNLSFVDSKGGVAVTIPGSAGTSGRTLALGKLIEDRRSGKAPAADEKAKDQKEAPSPHGQTADDHGQKAGHGQTASDHGQTAADHGQTAPNPQQNPQ